MMPRDGTVIIPAVLLATGAVLFVARRRVRDLTHEAARLIDDRNHWRELALRMDEELEATRPSAKQGGVN